MVYTRPDIAYTISVVSKYMSNLRKKHWEAIMCTLKYLCGNSNFHLEFGNFCGGVAGYVDLDDDCDLERLRSITCYVFTIGKCALSWKPHCKVFHLCVQSS